MKIAASEAVVPCSRFTRSAKAQAEVHCFSGVDPRSRGGPRVIQFSWMCTPRPKPRSSRVADSLQRRSMRAASARAWSSGARRAPQTPPRRFQGEDYWARPARGFGDPTARLAIVGLAPAAHGANRTGRMFTGDRSGDWLYAALHRAGYANQPDVRAAATTGCDCATPTSPPSSAARRRPTGRRPAERDNCLPYLARELALLEHCRTIVALGAFAWDGALRALPRPGRRGPRPKPRFGHGAEANVGRLDAARLLPPEPAEHLHRPPHRADARRGVRPGSRAAGRSSSALSVPASDAAAVSFKIALRSPAAMSAFSESGTAVHASLLNSSVR